MPQTPRFVRKRPQGEPSKGNHSASTPDETSAKVSRLAAITSVSQEMHEAAAIDGANRLRRVWSITIPCIMPTIVTMLILRCGSLLSVGFEKILLLYNPSIYSTADVISTHVQRLGIEKAQYGYSTAVGLFNSVINTVLLLAANYFSKKYTDTSVL